MIFSQEDLSARLFEHRSSYFHRMSGAAPETEHHPVFVFLLPSCQVVSLKQQFQQYRQ